MTVVQSSPRTSSGHGLNTSLDVLRALAIVLVVNCHAVSAYGLPNPLGFLTLGGVGVDLFFCLSGWLLGKQLCLEFKERGAIDVRRFWLRRWLRTLPAYYAVLGLNFLQAILQGQMPGNWPAYLVFLQNYTHVGLFGVSWSLCVEEYFYLSVAPLLLFCFQRPRTAVVVVPLFLAVPQVCRIMGWYGDLKMTHVRYDECATGVLLAYVAVFAPRVWQVLCKGLVFLVPLGLALAGYNVLYRIETNWGIGNLPLGAWALIFGSLVALANSSPFWKYRFNVWGAQFIALRAYSLYLLHVEAIALAKRLPHLPLPVFIAVVWVGSLLAAEVLYRLVELPFMRAREWFHSSRSQHPETGKAAPTPQHTSPVFVTGELKQATT